jgi:hypothetical protein
MLQGNSLEEAACLFYSVSHHLATFEAKLQKSCKTSPFRG